MAAKQVNFNDEAGKKNRRGADAKAGCVRGRARPRAHRSAPQQEPPSRRANDEALTGAAESEAATLCESCGMPMRAPDEFGTLGDGSRSKDYCRFCFARGRFIEPGLTMQAMIDRCTGLVAKQGHVTEPQARMLMDETIPRLKRWCQAIAME